MEEEPKHQQAAHDVRGCHGGGLLGGPHGFSRQDNPTSVLPHVPTPLPFLSYPPGPRHLASPGSPPTWCLLSLPMSMPTKKRPSSGCASARS